jgi:anti-sigma B factor antagonist
VEAPLLAIEHETVPGAMVVHAAGEIDLVTAPDLRAHLEKVCDRAAPPDSVIADLTGVSFLGSAGLSVLLDIDEKCRARQVALRIVATRPGTVRPLQVPGLDRVPQVVGSLELAIPR